MRVLPPLLVLCLCAGLGVWAWCGPGDDPPPGPRADLPGASANVGEPADFDQILPVTVEEPAEDPVSPDADAEESRTEVLTEADLNTGPRVQVIRGPLQQPVAEAVVFYVSEADAQARQRLQNLDLDRFLWPEQFGGQLHTNAEGTAHLPATRRPWLVCAVADGEFAFATVPPGDRTVQMPLEIDETVTVLVQAGDGTASARAPVALLQHREGEREAATLWQAATDGEGLAVCRHFQLVRPALRGPPDRERFAAVLAMALPAPVVRVFPGRPTSAETVRLQMVPHTSVQVTLTDHRDKPLLSPAGVALWNERPRDWQPEFPVPGNLERPRQQKPAGAAPVTFLNVGSNAAVRVGARFPNERRGAISEPLWTSPDPKEILRARLPVGPELAVVAGTIVTEEGRPYGPADLRCCWWSAERPLGECQISTIADGQFDLVQRPLDGTAELWLELRATLVADLPAEVAQSPQVRPEPTTVEVGARVRLQALRAGERRELGTIVLGELPPICSGIVVDDLGEPIANAEVKLQRNEPAPAPAPGRPDLNNLRSNNQRNNSQRDPWRDLPLQLTKTDGEGLFTLRGERPLGELRVRADTNRHFADTVPVRGPGDILRIVLVRNGILRGRVLLPGWIADGSVTMTLRPQDETLRKRDTRSIGLARGRGGRFTLEPLRAGRYDVLIDVRSVPEPLAVIGDVFITPGETRDPRLRLLDLRQSLFRYRLRAVDAGGRLMPLNGPILARVHKADGTIADAGFRWQRGRAELITGSSLAELIAFGQGCEPLALTLGPGDHDVYMRELNPARVNLPGLRGLCSMDHRVRISVILTEDTGFPQWLSGTDQRTGENFTFPRWELGKSNGAWLGLGDEVEVPIARSGKYQVVLRIYATDSERSQQLSVPLGVHELRVDTASLAPVIVPVDSQKVLDALSRLQQQQKAPQSGQAPARPPRRR
jgi:hypothetical protein